MAAAANCSSTVRLLLHHGAEATRQDRKGATPLHAAAGASAVEAVEALLGHTSGREAVRLTDDEGKLPLEIVSRAKASASAAAAKKVRKLLEAASMEASRKGSQVATTPAGRSKGRSEVGSSNNTNTAGGSGSRNVEGGSVAEVPKSQQPQKADTSQAKAVRHETEAEILHASITGESLAAARDLLAIELEKPLAREEHLAKDEEQPNASSGTDDNAAVPSDDQQTVSASPPTDPQVPVTEEEPPGETGQEVTDSAAAAESKQETAGQGEDDGGDGASASKVADKAAPEGQNGTNRPPEVGAQVPMGAAPGAPTHRRIREFLRFYEPQVSMQPATNTGEAARLRRTPAAINRWGT